MKKLAEKCFLVAFVAFLAQNAVVFAESIQNVKPKPGWNVATAPCRKIVEKGADDFLLVSMPTQVGTSVVTDVQVFLLTNRVPANVVWRDAKDLYALVDARSAKHGQNLRVYPVEGPIPNPKAETLRDPEPLRGCATRTAGMDYPANWADVLMLETRCDTPPTFFRATGFDGLPATHKDWFRGDWRRMSHVVELQTWLLVQTNTVLQFGLAGTAPAWLFLDGSNVLVHPPYQPYDKWTAGEPFTVAAGLRRVKVVTVLRQKIDTGLAWKRPGGPAMAADIRMVTGGDLLEGRWETRGSAVHPYAVAEEGCAYRFAEMPEQVFVPYTLTDKSAIWSTNVPPVAAWTIDGQAAGSGATLAATVLASGVHTAEVSVAGEKYAFPLGYSGKIWREEHISTRVTGVPAYCFDDTDVSPILSVRTTAPDNLAFDLAVTVFKCRDLSQESVVPETVQQTYPVKTLHGAGRVYLSSFWVGGVERVEWTLLHHGVALERGELRLMEEPYETLPTAVSGELLKAGAAFVTLAVPRASAWAGTEEDFEGRPAENSVLLVAEGDMWSALTNQFSACVKATATEDGVSGKASLLPFTALAGHTNAATVVYAPEVRLADVADIDGFECRVSAMMGLLKSPAMGSPAVTVIVPPMADVLPDCGCEPGEEPCAHARLAREIAESIMRAADAQGLATIDLFTAFQTAESPVPLVRNARLTSAGAAIFQSLSGTLPSPSPDSASQN